MKRDKNLSMAELEGNQASGNTSEAEGRGEGGGVRVSADAGFATVEKEAAGDRVCVGDCKPCRELQI